MESGNEMDLIHKIRLDFTPLDFRVQKNNITFRKDAQQKKNVTEKSKQTCPYAITFGTKIGNVQNVAREIVVITT